MEKFVCAAGLEKPCNHKPWSNDLSTNLLVVVDLLVKQLLCF